MERWISACEEESKLEEYNKDESRFNATRGAHLNLKRAERARVIVAKLPNLLESLKSKTRSWEDERGRPFLYNGISLLAILEEYSLLRREKEEEKRRLREEKRMQEQLQTEQELLYGTKPSKKGQVGLRVSGNNANRRLSIVPEPLPAPKASNQGPQKGSRVKRYSPMMNYVALPKDPEASSIGSAPDSPVAA
ncbi:65-kDa microtubule-associated protein 1-like isoform X2 [Selaginella moellendorffii]|uniref:65-kDa microtubule-associated protein 1-like isoform X2 n=1 Tax=Selaginella moellendorffii TaxID=88036 RepID=UPI000D1CB4FE|nr:65-kDa microtubule-associated protein 1-like isoform X2 [Selaginella moellendorffii]|eukprot:XP_024534486.1 65-kDa microtubule-associated protein 1-like isoform X2 [Selaginella moellendorffii]